MFCSCCIVPNHVEGHSTAFGTGLNYVTLRILDVDAEHPVCVKARARALPKWLPFHPHRGWIHTRAVYLPMSYLYGVRFRAPEDDLIQSLRQVSAFMYVNTWQRFMQLDRNSILKTFIKSDQRNIISAADLYMPHSALYDVSISSWHVMSIALFLRSIARV